MKMDEFEDVLNQMSTPEIGSLKHEDLLAKGITKVNDKSTVSIWWASIPVYLIAAFIMKGLYTPEQSIASVVRELFSMKSHGALLLLLILPVILVIINLISARQLYYLYGNSSGIAFLKVIWTEALIIILSLFILLIYFYEALTT